MNADSLGLYVHIPFCASRCRYCGFVSNIYDHDFADRYLEALRMELNAQPLTERRFSTIFIGGGTPSSLSVRQLESLLKMLPLGWAKEVSIEANPESATEEKLRLFSDNGVTRVSIGVQTFSHFGVKLLGRPHDPVTAQRRVAAAAARGFHSVNMDLIAGWPGQTASMLLADLAIAVDSGTTHLSCYELMRLPGSELTRALKAKAIPPQSDREARKFWDVTERFLGDHGFGHYEISNYSPPGFECRHNVNAWKGGEYIGVGVAAHSHLLGARYWNVSDAAEYVRRITSGDSPVEGSETLEADEKARETAVFWLRLSAGIDAAEFGERTGICLEHLYYKELPYLLGAGGLEWRIQAGRRFLRLTKQSYPVADAVLIDMV
ncbi:MAG: radical SAM family heme chaperone HemW [Planctomycetota bacterium]|jgi:oxygen-independent coproporphyrinogen-3 oxidase|nr:radical SAM family heme chaperone HemW [Planctomycetota bacterium]